MGKSSSPQIALSPSENLHEALEACRRDYSCSEHTVGPWDGLASWYWEYWNEINHSLSRQCADDRIPSKPLRDTLVSLYFKHVHPLCPIFDEIEFYTCYYLEDEDMAFLKAVSLLEFQAMMFAASLHLNNLQICNTKYQSTYLCHKSLFEIADMTYHAGQDRSPVVLTRAAILLSYWSPYTTEKHTNNYWIDQAFFHAHAAKLHEADRLPTSSISPGQGKLIWWCCLLRDRLLAFGLRRTQRLHQEPLDYPLPTVDNFGTEERCAKFLDSSCTMLYINNFIAQCKLSIVMAKILKFMKERALVSAADCTKKRECRYNDTEFDKVTSLHVELISWNKEFQGALEQAPGNMPHVCSMPCQMTRLHYRSVVASLYLPYTFPASGQVDEYKNFHDIAFIHVKEAVSQIAKSIEILAYNIESNDIPCSIGAWISFPIAVKIIFVRNSRHLEDPTTELREMCSLMDLLCILKDRFSGGQFISSILDAVMSQAFLVRGTGNKQEISRLLQDAASMIDSGLACGIVPNAKL